MDTFSMQLTWLRLLKCCYGYKYSAFVFHHFRIESIHTLTHSHTPEKYDGIQIAWILYEYKLQLIDYMLSFKSHSTSSLQPPLPYASFCSSSKLHIRIHTHASYSDAFHPVLALRNIQWRQQINFVYVCGYSISLIAILLSLGVLGYFR